MIPTISLCMIVKDEQKVLERCLESVAGKVSEIILVDTGSTDQTLEIARKYHAKVYSYNWNDDFAAARNYSLEHATSDYILVLDADEYLEPEANLQEELLSRNDFYLVDIKNFMSDGRFFSHSAIRLFVNTPKLRYKNRLHEHLDIDEIEFELTRSVGKFTIQHTGYTNETMLEKDKDNRNLPIMLAEVKENPTSYNMYNLAKTYMNFGDFDLAVRYFQKAYPGSANKLYQPELLRKLGESLLQLHRADEALAILYDAVKIHPEDATLTYILGRTYQTAGYLKDAEQTWRKCLTMQMEGPFTSEGVTSYLSYYELAGLYEEQGKYDEAHRAIVKAIRLKPGFAPSLKKYLEVAYSANLSPSLIQTELSSMYKLNQVEDLQMLLDVLYTLGHPLLQEYMQKYRIHTETNVHAIAYQYSKQYELAREYWMLYIQNHQTFGRNTIDVLALAFLQQDLELFNLAKPSMNLSDKELKLLRSLISRQPLAITKLSKNTEDWIFDILEKLIYQQEFNSIQEFIALMEQTYSAFQYRLGKTLFQHGYNEAAIDVLVKVHEARKNDIEVNRLLGDICARAGYLEDANLFYATLLKLNANYDSYERMLQLLDQQKETQQYWQLVKDAKQKFPFSLWLEEELNNKLEKIK